MSQHFNPPGAHQLNSLQQHPTPGRENPYFSEESPSRFRFSNPFRNPASTAQTITNRHPQDADTDADTNINANADADADADASADDSSPRKETPSDAPTTDIPAPPGIHFRSMTWWQCGIVMIAETVSLGILALPSVLATVGLVPGIILILGLGTLAWYSGIVMHQFRGAYPGVGSWADAVEVLVRGLGCARAGREVGGAAQLLFVLFVMGSHLLTWVICLDVLTGHAACNIVWGAVGMFVFWILDLPRTFRGMSFLSLVSFASILIAVIMTMIALGIQAPAEKKYTLWAKEDLSLREAFLSVTNIVFAYGGHVGFFNFMAELHDPADFPKSLVMLQIVEIILYIVSAIVIYVYAGSAVESPALGSAGPILSKVAFGIAIPTIVIAGVIFGHVGSKYIFNRIFQGTLHATTRTRLSTFSWLAITALLWVLAWIIAESIPVFNELLGLVSSLFASWFTFGLAGVFWLFLNQGHWNRDWKMRGLFCCNVLLLVVGALICGMGLWASGVSISEGARMGKSWSCGRVEGRE